jgi:hypothetical protein
MGLFKPAWQSDNMNKALSAVKKVTDQAKLARIVRESKCSYVRQAAVQRMTDQAELMKIMQESKNSDVHLEAVQRITDQAKLAHIVWESKCSYVRGAAVQRMTDQAELMKIMNESNKSDGIRCVAVQRITDQAELVKIAKNDSSSSVCCSAIKKITDKSVLIEIIQSAKNEDARREACGKVGHDFEGCKCKRCGAEDYSNHEWNKCVCSLCGGLRLRGYKKDSVQYHAGPMIEVGQCKIKCSACGTVLYDHVYHESVSGGAMYYGCKKCGQGGYSRTSSVQIGVVKEKSDDTQSGG